MKLMILDGNSVINRAFYGVRLLSTKDGLYTNAVFGFLSILSKLTESEKPEALCVAFDMRAPTFRHECYEQYKAQRKGMPEELAVQMPVVKEVLAAMRIPILQLEGYEADDIIGTVSRLCSERGDECVIVTGDKDSLQLVGEHVRVKLVATRMGQTTEKDYTPEQFMADYGFEPEHMVDLKALMGDASDNIPGVKGVGEKTAMELVGRYRSLDAIYAGLDTLEMKEGVRKKLREDEEMARLSYELATIDTHAPVDINFEDVLVCEPDGEKLYELFLRLEFNKLIEKYGLGPAAKTAAKEQKPLKIELLEDEKTANAWLESCKTAECVAVTATGELSAVAMASSGRTAIVRRDSFAGDYTGFLHSLMLVDIKKSGHDIKNLMRALLELEIEAEGFVFDTALAAYLLSPSDGSYARNKLSVAYLGREIPDEKLFAAADAFAPLGDAQAASEALCAHALCVAELTPLLKARLAEQDMLGLLHEIELPLCTVLAEMEHTGFKVDAAALRDYGDMLSKGIAAVEERIYGYAGEPFNINSTRALGELLFEKLGLPPVKKTKTGYSTNIDVLEKLRGKHPIIEDIIDYRTLTKLRSTYVDGLLKVIAPDGRIHTSFMMTVTATGRLSSTEPNLQNIPVRTELGQELRRMFVAPEGELLVDADYSQIELRVLAHISHDEMMKKAFTDGEDIHRVTASQVLGIPPEQVTQRQRSAAKAVNFGIVYGISDFSLAQDIGVTRLDARQYIDSYLEKYSGVREYMHSVVENAKRDGYVTTLMGRRRQIPELKSTNYNIRSFGERVAMNTPIQGTAADLIKLAMVRVYARLKAEKMEARLILQIHDELIIEAPEAEAERCARILREEMSGVARLDVPLTADANIGKTWYEAK